MCRDAWNFENNNINNKLLIKHIIQSMKSGGNTMHNKLETQKHIIYNEKKISLLRLIGNKIVINSNFILAMYPDLEVKIY